MKIDPKTVTLDLNQRNAIQRALYIAIRDVTIKRNRCSEGGAKWNEHDKHVANFADLLTTFHEMK